MPYTAPRSYVSGSLIVSLRFRGRGVNELGSEADLLAFIEI